MIVAHQPTPSSRSRVHRYPTTIISSLSAATRARNTRIGTVHHNQSEMLLDASTAFVIPTARPAAKNTSPTAPPPPRDEVPPDHQAPPGSCPVTATLPERVAPVQRE